MKPIVRGEREGAHAEWCLRPVQDPAVFRDAADCAVEVGRINAPAGDLDYDVVAPNSGERRTLQVSISDPESILVAGANVLAVHLLNQALTSSDIWIDGSLIDNAGPGFGPTPGALNATFQTHLPPRLRQVRHTPKQPASGQAVAITAKATDPDGVASLTLHYQLVDPGDYIERNDPAYETAWTAIPMVDTGLDGDAVAGDDVYTAVIPAGHQIHRRLVRYRITATNGIGLELQVPYPDDPQPNFAYFVYDGVPAWQGAVRPGATPILTFPAEEMSRLPAYHLIAKRDDIEDCTWFDRYRGNEYLWTGTLVYDGVVYDHVPFRARGGDAWRYAMVKNMWKFRFLRGHGFQARDDWGGEYPRTWRRLNLGASIQQGDYNHRGEQGMFEAVGFRMFNLAGVEAPNTSFVTFRIIDDAEEVSADQFEGDFWGLYLAAEQIDGRFLDAHDLPDGNIYKMEQGTGPGDGELKHQGADQVGDSSDLVQFRNQASPGASEAWWRSNLDVARYCSYFTIVQAIHHYDICCWKNYYYFFNGATGLMQVHPWDLDLTWADNMYLAGDGGTDQDMGDNGIFQVPGIRLELENRVRELLDLLCNTDQGWQLLDEYAGLLAGSSGGPTILDADRAMWDYNPKMNDSAYSSSPGKAGTGRYYQFPFSGAEGNFYTFMAANGLTAPIQGSFAAGVQKMKYYLQYRSGSTSYPFGDALATWATDTQIPATPTVTYTGPAGFPLSALSFRASNYSGAAAFAGLRWRIAEVAPAGAPAHDPESPRPYEIEALWESGDVTDPSMRDVLIPPDSVRAGSTYRVRCRMQDATGRWSRWSAPVEFVTAEPLSAPLLRSHLRISEVMYHAPAGSEFDFVELYNTSPDTALDLAGAKFTQGIDYVFPQGAVILPGQYLLVVEHMDAAAFRAHYGLDADVPVLGPYTGSLSNGGEALVLRTSAGGEDIAAFEYDDGLGWPQSADGSGHSLIPLRLDDQAGGALDYPGHWKASTFIGGSPGAADPPSPDSIVINEFAAHTDFDVPPPLDSNDWIELYNPGSTDFTFGPDWYLSDIGDRDQLTRWMIPAETTIPAGGFIAFDEQTGFHNPPTTGFGLNKAGEAVFLSYLPGSAQDRVVDCVTFGGQEDETSQGRWPDGGEFWYTVTSPTRGAPNSAPPQRVTINELMYNPPDSVGFDGVRDEYIELRNPTDAAVDLYNDSGPWRLSGGMDFAFPPGAALPAGGHVLIVTFDPADTATADAFRAAYALPAPGPILWGPYSGRLGNRTDRVALERPQAPDAPGDDISWVTVDEVIYLDQSPWPESADGLGPSLHRIDPLLHGSDPANWTATHPSPGTSQTSGDAPTITIQPAPPSRTVDTGTAVTYSVTVTGDPPITYQWRRDGIAVPGAVSDIFHLPSAQPADSGSYAVLVLNAAGSVLSDPVHLQVITPPQILSQPESAIVAPGATVTFEVQATGTGPLSYAWQFNGSPLIGPASPTLMIGNVQESSVGTYVVTVTDDNASVVSEPAELRLLIPPEVLEPPFDRSVAPGVPVTFSVVTRGLTPMTYQWKKDGVTVATEVLDANTGSFTIPSAQPADAGIYTVTLTNQALGPPGVESSGALLTILIDSDGDGMPDSWENLYQFDPDDPDDAGLDADGDGFTNLEEYLANTHPRDPASFLRIDGLESDLAGQGWTRVTFPAAPERTYTVEFKDSMGLALWQELVTIPAALTHRNVEVSDTPPDTTIRRFYRVAIPHPHAP